MKKRTLLLALIAGILILPIIGTSNIYAAHKHDKQVKVVSAAERNGYIDVKWKKDKSCKSYCVHLQCGSKVLYNHCVGKTQSHYKIKVTKTLGKNLDKCGNWKAVVYCSNKAKGAGGSGHG